MGPAGTVAGARIRENGDCLSVDIWLDRGTLPHHLRTDLARGVLAHPTARPGRTLLAAFPCGESELLEGLRSGLTGVQTRVAGSTCLLEGRIR